MKTRNCSGSQRNTLKNSYSKIVWNMETLCVVERVSTTYDGPWALCKESDAQKAAQSQQTAFNAQLQKIYQTQFGEQQAILSVLTPQLEGMAANPEGFGATEYAALQAGIVNDTGAQYSSVAKQAATEFATSNEAGLPSGVEAQVQGQIAAGAAGQVAGQSSQLAIANEQMKQQQQQFALSSLSGIQSGVGSQMESTGNQNLTGISNQFGQATQVYNQGQQLWQSILGGVAGAGMDFLTGGLSSAVQGNSFLEGGVSGMSGAH